VPSRVRREANPSRRSRAVLIRPTPSNASRVHADVVSKMPVLPYDAPAAEWHACERDRLEAAGRTMPYAGGQIAAIAVVHRLTLVTANVRHFRQVEGLRVDDWLS
jgi:predicted nucleic acid-binding protein